ncbi:uncharacterized protein LOC110678879 [Aedes aegypti]|uniref:THAP-type domain-containing protein n=1 Tax=Aedes aegypti TaxID=7159 RepID=A0A6I8TYC0_AEDAE|nr:uncharacterized protein LOC110678879 [Aedes aegypti]
MAAVKCVVPSCLNVFTGSVKFFGVPSAGSNFFKKWCQFMELSGHGKEKICQAHFRDSNFICKTRQVLKNSAVPPSNILKHIPSIDKGQTCCVAGCRTRAKSALLPFPSKAKSKQLKLWKQSLGMNPTDAVTGMRICRRHFAEVDLRTVKFMYLKPNAVPSRKVKKLVEHPRLLIPSTAPLPPALRDHTYSYRRFVAKSRRMCAVYGCSSRAGNGISLHSFPPKNDKRYKAWISALKFGKTPSKNAKVCNLHFTGANYYLGGKHLKADAIPTRKLPKVHRFQNEDAYTSFRKEKTDRSDCEHGAEINPSDTTSSDDPAEMDNISHSTEHPSILEPERLALTDTEISHTNVIKRSIVPDSFTTASQSSSIDANGKTNPLAHLNQRQSNQSEQKNDLELKLRPNNDSELVKQFGETWYPLEKQSKDFSCQVVAQDLKSRDMILPDLLITDQDVNTWTGLPSLELLQEICCSVQKLETVYPRKWAMHPTDRVILTMAKIKQNLSFAALGTLFRIHSATVAQYFSHTVHMLAEILSTFVYMPEKKEIKQNIPLCFREHFSNVTIVLDCTETPIATLKCLNCRIYTYSQYKSTRTAKFLIGVTGPGPAGPNIILQ